MFRSNPYDLLNALKNFHVLLIMFCIIPFKFDEYMTSKKIKFFNIFDFAYRAVTLVIFLIGGYLKIQFQLDGYEHLPYKVMFEIHLRFQLIYGLISTSTIYPKIYRKFFNLKSVLPINYKIIKNLLNVTIIIVGFRLGLLLTTSFFFIKNTKIGLLRPAFEQGCGILLHCQLTVYLWVVFRFLKVFNQFLMKFNRNIRVEQVPKVFELFRGLMMEYCDLVELMHRVFSVNIGLQMASDMIATVEIFYYVIHSGLIAIIYLVEPVIATVCTLMVYRLLDAEVGFVKGCCRKYCQKRERLNERNKN